DAPADDMLGGTSDSTDTENDLLGGFGDDFSSAADSQGTDDFSLQEDSAFDLSLDEPRSEGTDPLDDFSIGGSDSDELSLGGGDDLSAGSLDIPDSLGGSSIDDTFDSPVSDDFSLSDSPPLANSSFSSESDDASFSDVLGVDDLAEMSEQAQMQQGIGEEFTDEDLAKIRDQLINYPESLKKSVIDAIVNEKISHPDQRLLMNMVMDQADASTIADFLEPRLGYRPDLTPSSMRADGVQILYTDGMSPEELRSRRRNAKILAALFGLAIIAVGSIFSGIKIFHSYSVQGKYEEGLEEIYLAGITTGEERKQHKENAEKLYQTGLDQSGGNHSIEFMNRYGIAYMYAGLYEDAFIKLFGKITPEPDWSNESQRAPLIRLSDGSSWPSEEGWKSGRKANFVDRSNIRGQLLIPGAYTTARLRDEELDRTTLINLGRFHSFVARDFIEARSGKKYKNDNLGIDYYKLILTLMNRPDDVEAMAKIGDVYYNRKDFIASAREFNKILDKSPAAIEGHSGIIKTYVEIWKEEKDPRFIIARHRHIQKLGLEDDLPIHTLSKLASFYIDMNEDELRIKYQIDPKDSISGMDIKDNAVHLLEIIFNREEQRDEQLIVGSQYGEGFYQRGRYLISQKESYRALKQFQNAHKYDPDHFLAVNAIGEYYMNLLEYDRAADYFLKAVEIHGSTVDNLGSHPEDETLLEGDIGKIYYNLGSLLYLKYSGINDSKFPGFPNTKIYPDRAMQVESGDIEMRKEELRKAREYFAESLKMDIKDPIAKINAVYRKGWIDYINGDFESALNTWETLDIDYDANYSDPALLMARGNSYFYTDQTRTALGNYLKVKDDFEKMSMNYSNPNPDDSRQRVIYQSLAAVYNNIGALYEKEHSELSGTLSQRKREDLESESLQYYWKAIEASKKINVDNETARTNVQLGFKRGSQKQPLIDDWISPVLLTLEE
ncbi:MAG: tetratricopeptide repeat protein, partial [Spirochaetia bacterium]|nr:tetratricopeptide repeat protein [Spirochaetia bacterium]